MEKDHKINTQCLGREKQANHFQIYIKQLRGIENRLIDKLDMLLNRLSPVLSDVNPKCEEVNCKEPLLAECELEREFILLASSFHNREKTIDTILERLRL